MVINRQYEILCPGCNQKILITVSESNLELIAVTFFDILDSSETTYLARELGYEFGTQGGECNG